MELIFKMPDGSSHRVLFPRVGEWQTGEIKDVDTETRDFLIKHHGAFIHDYVKPKPKKKKEAKIEVPQNEFKEAIEDASEKVEIFYKSEDEGGEI